MTIDTFVYPDWPAPPHVKCLTTTRTGGVSQPPFAALNLGEHVGDQPASVAANRQWLKSAADLPAMPLWLKQTHSCKVINSHNWQPDIEADAIIAADMHTVCAILTADCLPVMLCQQNGKQVAAVHAGWRGLQAGILARAIKQLNCPPTEILAWLGPAIGPQQFEVGDEVRQAFLECDADTDAAFIPNRPGHFLADIYLLARQQLQKAGLSQIFGGDFCTVSQPQTFFSYRRDGQTGRMASLIWLSAE